MRPRPADPKPTGPLSLGVGERAGLRRGGRLRSPNCSPLYKVRPRNCLNLNGRRTSTPIPRSHGRPFFRMIDARPPARADGPRFPPLPNLTHSPKAVNRDPSSSTINSTHFHLVPFAPLRLRTTFPFPALRTHRRLRPAVHRSSALIRRVLQMYGESAVFCAFCHRSPPIHFLNQLAADSRTKPIWNRHRDPPLRSHGRPVPEQTDPRRPAAEQNRADRFYVGLASGLPYAGVSDPVDTRARSRGGARHAPAPSIRQALRMYGLWLVFCAFCVRQPPIHCRNGRTRTGRRSCPGHSGCL